MESLRRIAWKKILSMLPASALSGNDTIQTLASAQTVTGLKNFAPVSGAVEKLGGVSIFVQDATPTANAADDLWYETDTNLWWMWSGSFWLSPEIHTYTIPPVVGISATSAQSYMPIYVPSSMNMFVVDVFADLFVSTTNDGTQYWSVQLQRIAADQTTTNVATTPSTISLAPSNWLKLVTSVNALLDLSTDIKALAIIYNKNSTPGALYGVSGVSYRLAHP